MKSIYSVEDLSLIDQAVMSWEEAEGREDERRQFFPDEERILIPKDAYDTMNYYAGMGHPLAKAYFSVCAVL